MKKFLCIVLLAAFCLTLTACGCEHQWKEADCENPRTCTKCGETEGEPLGHDWMEADCEHVKTCSRCNATEGEPLGHDVGEWSEPREDYVHAKIVREKKCQRCNQVIETDEKPMTSLVEDGVFVGSPHEALQRFEYMIKENHHFGYTVEEDFMEVVEETENGKVTSREYLGNLLSGEDKFGFVHFTKDLWEGDTFTIMPIDESDKDESGFSSISLSSYNADKFVAVSVPFILTCDPSLTPDEAMDILLKALDLGEQGESVDHNGISYSIDISDYGVSMIAMLL